MRHGGGKGEEGEGGDKVGKEKRREKGRREGGDEGGREGGRRGWMEKERWRGVMGSYIPPVPVF